MKPTIIQINNFFNILDESFNEQLLPGAEIFSDQCEYFHKYGEFFAQVGEDNYKKVCQKLAVAVASYNLSSKESSSIFQDSWDYKKVSKSLKKAQQFKETIPSTQDLIENKRNQKFLMFNELLDEYIADLEKISKRSGTGPTIIVPPSHFGKRAKRTKTPIINVVRNIIDEYGIVDHSPNSKKLVDAL